MQNQLQNQMQNQNFPQQRQQNQQLFEPANSMLLEPAPEQSRDCCLAGRCCSRHISVFTDGLPSDCSPLVALHAGQVA
jgi:hypothetical protein